MQTGPSEPGRRSAEEVDADLGKVIVDAVKVGRGNRRWLKWISVPILFDIALSVAVIVAFAIRSDDQAKFHRAQVETCQRLNQSNAGQRAFWEPTLALPRAPLKPDATADERKAYDEVTKARAQFERNLHLYFDPIEC